jgi:hypothetical protein
VGRVASSFGSARRKARQGRAGRAGRDEGEFRLWLVEPSSGRAGNRRGQWSFLPPSLDSDEDCYDSTSHRQRKVTKMGVPCSLSGSVLCVLQYPWCIRAARVATVLFSIKKDAVQ